MAEAPLAGCAATRSRRDGFGSGFQPRLDAGLFERGVVLDGVVDPGVVDVIDAVGAVDACDPSRPPPVRKTADDTVSVSPTRASMAPTTLGDTRPKPPAMARPPR